MVASLCLLLFHAAAPASPGPDLELDDLLPPAARRTEKRTFGDESRGYDDRRAGGGAAFSPDGKWLIVGSANRGVMWWDVATGRPSYVQPGPSYGQGFAAAFTPDGKQVITTSSGGHNQVYPVSAWDATRRLLARSLDEGVNDTPFTAVAVSPDGKTAAFGSGFNNRRGTVGPRDLVFWDVASGDEIGRFDGFLKDPATATPGRQPMIDSYEALAYAPDGRSLAALASGRLVLVEMATGKPRGEVRFPATPPPANPYGLIPSGSLAFAPDGRTIAVGCPDGAIRHFDLRTGRERPPLGGHAAGVVALHWAGGKLYSYSSDGQLCAWRVPAGEGWRPKSGTLSPAALGMLWDALRGDDPADQYGCVQTLLANPEQAVAMLRTHLKPAAKGDEERIDRLVSELKGGYNARKRAVVELRKIGSAAAPALQRSMAGGGYDELVQRLYHEFVNLPASPEQGRSLRAVAVLERIGSDAARKVLEGLAAGSEASAVTTEAKAALDRVGKPAAAKVPVDPDDVWQALAGEPAAAYQTIRAVAAGRSVAWLGTRLKAVTFDDDPKRVAKLIGELDSDDFAVRDTATKALRELGRTVEPALKAALAGKPELEKRKRLEGLVAGLAKGSPPDILRGGRALEALEMSASSEAVRALEELAKSGRAVWVRKAAGEAVKRLRGGKG